MSNHEHVGRRYQLWIADTEPRLTASQKAESHEKFAAEFASLPPWQEPYAGWGATMAYLCRRIARRHRGLPLDEWAAPMVNREPASDRVDARPAPHLG